MVASRIRNRSIARAYALPHSEKLAAEPGPVRDRATGHVAGADRHVGAPFDRCEQSRQHRRVVGEVGVHLDDDVEARRRARDGSRVGRRRPDRPCRAGAAPRCRPAPPRPSPRARRCRRGCCRRTTITCEVGAAARGWTRAAARCSRPPGRSGSRVRNPPDDCTGTAHRSIDTGAAAREAVGAIVLRIRRVASRSGRSSWKVPASSTRQNWSATTSLGSCEPGIDAVVGLVPQVRAASRQDQPVVRPQLVGQPASPRCLAMPGVHLDVAGAGLAAPGTGSRRTSRCSWSATGRRARR